MQSTEQVETQPAPSCCAPAAKSRWLNTRNVLIGAAVLSAGALFLSWNWLVAAGVASIIVGVLPCLAMCAVGICAGRMGRKDSGPGDVSSVSPKAIGVEVDSESRKRLP